MGISRFFRELYPFILDALPPQKSSQQQGILRSDAEVEPKAASRTGCLGAIAQIVAKINRYRPLTDIIVITETLWN